MPASARHHFAEPFDFTVKGLVKEARGNSSQAEFSKQLKVSQGTLSRYESGETSPPARVIEFCMHKLHNEVISKDPLMQFLHERMLSGLAGVEGLRLRTAVACIVDALAGTTNQGAVKSQADQAIIGANHG